MQYLELRADEVQPGDVWLWDDSRILVTGVELTDDPAYALDGEIAVARISGRIVRGMDRGTSGTWTRLASSGTEVER